MASWGAAGVQVGRVVEEVEVGVVLCVHILENWQGEGVSSFHQFVPFVKLGTLKCITPGGRFR